MGSMRIILFAFLFCFAGFSTIAQPLPKPQPTEVRLPKYLKVWNETLTFGQALAILTPSGHPRLQQWYRNHRALLSPHQISVDFLDRDQFFIHSPHRLVLYNMANLQNNVLMISRKPFVIREDEPLASLEARLESATFGKPTKTFSTSWISGLLITLQQLFVSPAMAVAPPALEWAPIVTILDVYWRHQSHAPPFIGGTSKSLPTTIPFTSRPALNKPTTGTK